MGCRGRGVGGWFLTRTCGAWTRPGVGWAVAALLIWLVVGPWGGRGNGQDPEIGGGDSTLTRPGAGLRLGQRRDFIGGGAGGAGRAPLPGLWARQDPQDVCLFVASHTFQAAATDGGLGVRAPFERVAHVLVGFQTAGRR